MGIEKDWRIKMHILDKKSTVGSKNRDVCMVTSPCGSARVKFYTGNSILNNCITGANYLQEYLGERVNPMKVGYSIHTVDPYL